MRRRVSVERRTCDWRSELQDGEQTTSPSAAATSHALTGRCQLRRGTSMDLKDDDDGGVDAIHAHAMSRSVAEKRHPLDVDSTTTSPAGPLVGRPSFRDKSKQASTTALPPAVVARR